MSIVTVKATSYRELSLWWNQYDSVPIDSWEDRRRPHGIFIISILGYGEEPLFPKNYSKSTFFTTSFTDIDMDVFEKNGIKTTDPNIFKPEQARQIVEFIHQANQGSNRDGLIVQCNAGWSRSGAVAEFVKEFCSIPQVEFEEDNPRITPNSYVLRLLREDSFFVAERQSTKGSGI